MSTKFSEDFIPLTDLKTNPGRVMKHVSDAHRPVLLTSRGRGVAVVQSVADFEETEEERAFMRAQAGAAARIHDHGARLDEDREQAKLGSASERPLERQVVLVTGGAGAIGVGIGEACAAAGAHVVLADIDAAHRAHPMPY